MLTGKRALLFPVYLNKYLEKAYYSINTLEKKTTEIFNEHMKIGVLFIDCGTDPYFVATATPRSGTPAQAIED